MSNTLHGDEAITTHRATGAPLYGHDWREPVTLRDIARGDYPAHMVWCYAPGHEQTPPPVDEPEPMELDWPGAAGEVDHEDEPRWSL